MIPDLRIEGWQPGAQDHDRVYIVEVLGGNVTKPFAMNVGLREAQIIVNCVRFCRDAMARLKSMESDR